MKIIVLGNQARAMVNFWSVLIRRMKAGGHEVLCCAPGGDAAADAALAAQGSRMRHFSVDRKGLNPLHDVRTLMELRRIFCEEKPDLLFASTIKPVIYGCTAARMVGVPQVYATITGLGYAFEADSFFKKCINRLGVLLYRTALAKVQGVFFQNQDDIETFRQSGILQPDARVLTARGTGVDIARFAAVPLPGLVGADAASETAGATTGLTTAGATTAGATTAGGGQRLAGPLIFLLVGRLLEAKGLPEYAAAARLLKTRHPEARFQLLGPPEQGLGSVPLEQVRAWEAEGGIEYLGETRDVRPYLAAAHVLVLPSHREGTPTAVMEAMSMGRPAVVTDAPGCREVVREGVNGRLVPVGDVTALAEAMESFILDPAAVIRMGAAGREAAVREFDAEKVAARILRDMHVSDAEKTEDNA